MESGYPYYYYIICTKYDNKFGINQELVARLPYRLPMCTTMPHSHGDPIYFSELNPVFSKYLGKAVVTMMSLKGSVSELYRSIYSG